MFVKVMRTFLKYSASSVIILCAAMIFSCTKGDSSATPLPSKNESYQGTFNKSNWSITTEPPFYHESNTTYSGTVQLVHHNSIFYVIGDEITVSGTSLPSSYVLSFESGSDSTTVAYNYFFSLHGGASLTKYFNPEKISMNIGESNLSSGWSYTFSGNKQ